jgi:hypothetical protein
MYFPKLVVLPCLLTSAFATMRNLTGSFSEFRVVDMKSENHAVGDLYDSCNEYNQDGDLVSAGKGCVAALLRSTYQVLSAATQVQPAIVVQNGTLLDEKLSNKKGASSATATTTNDVASMSTSCSSSSAVTLTTSLGQYSPPQPDEAKLNRRSDIADSILLQRINHELSERGGGKLGVRALSIEESEVHPTDGVAIRTNIHGNNAILHVHTNGSSATAEFKKGTDSWMTRRDQDVSIAHNFRFSDKSFGIKMQINKISRVNASMSDMQDYWNAFGFGTGESWFPPLFYASDTWKFVVCDKGSGVVAGKVIALEGPSDYVYESVDDAITCA